MIGRGGEKGSGISVLTARKDDDNDDESAQKSESVCRVSLEMVMYCHDKNVQLRLFFLGEVENFSKDRRISPVDLIWSKLKHIQDAVILFSISAYMHICVFIYIYIYIRKVIQ